MVHLELLAGLREQACLVRACAATQLRFARRRREIRRRATHVVDVSLEFRVARKLFRFLDERRLASRRHDAPLMECERAEAAFAEASAIARQAEFHFLNCRYTARSFVIGVVVARIRQGIHRIEFLGGKRLLRRVLHHEHIVRVFLHQTLSAIGVGVFPLHIEAARIFEFVGLERLERGQLDGVFHAFERSGLVSRAVDERDIFHGNARRERIGDFDNSALAHAINKQVGAGIEQNRALKRIGPIVVMRQATQARFNTAQNNGRVLVRSSNEIAVHRRGVVRAPIGCAARRIGILAAWNLVYGVMIHHRVHIA